VKALFTILKNPSFRLEDIPDYKELLKPFGNALPYFPPQKASTPSGPVYFIPPECAISYRMATEKVPFLFVCLFFFVPLSISDLVLFCFGFVLGCVVLAATSSGQVFSGRMHGKETFLREFGTEISLTTQRSLTKRQSELPEASFSWAMW